MKSERTKKSQELCRVNKKGKIETWKIRIEFSKNRNIVYLTEYVGKLDKKKNLHMGTIEGKCFHLGKNLWKQAEDEFNKRISNKHSLGYF